MAARIIAAAVALAAAAIGGGIYWQGERHMTQDSVQGELAVAIGDTIAEVAARSTYPLNTRILTDYDLSAADRPVRLRYLGPGGLSFQTRTVAINSAATIVTGIESAPQLEYVGRSGVAELLEQMEERLRTAGWKPKPDPTVTDRADLPAALADPGRSEITAWHVGAYAIDGTELTLRLRRLHGVGAAFPDGAYLLNFVWGNDDVRRRAEALAETLRREDDVSPTTSRPVDAATYGARVRAVMPR